MCNMFAISVFLCSQTSSKVWDWTLVVLWCGRAGGQCTVTWLPNFPGWVDLLTHGAPQARFARQSCAIILRQYILCIFVFLNSTKFLGLNHWQRSVVHFCSCPKSKGNILQKALTFPAFLRLLDIPIRRTFYSMLTTDSKGNVRAIEKVAVFLKHRV